MDISRRRFVAVLAVAIIITILSVSYAATTLNISNSGIVNVSTGLNILASLTNISASTICSPSTGPYSDTGLSITSWSLIVGGPPQTVYGCIWNNSSQPRTLAITGSGFPTGVAFSSTGGGSIPGNAYAPVSFTLTASTSATTGAFTGASISIA